MKTTLTGIILILLCLAPEAREKYPAFDRDYWLNEQALAEGKIKRGVGLGILGLLSVWPTTVMITDAYEKPHEYGALSAVCGLSSLSATMHGFRSISFGLQQRHNAATFVSGYGTSLDSSGISAQKSEYLHNRRKTTGKVFVLGTYLATTSTVFLANGIVQSVRKGQGKELHGIHLWPYYTAGALLMTAGIRIIISSKRKLDDLNVLQRTVSDPPRAGLLPYLSVEENGHPVFGLLFSGSL